MSHLQRLIRNNETTLIKTSCYYVLHVLVAACVTFAVTGDWHAAFALSLLEPSVQAVAYFVHETVWGRVRQPRYRTLIKTMTYYAMHLVVAASVAYAVTGDWVTALTLSLLEPTVQMVSFYLHEKFWEKRLQRKVHRTITLVCASATGCERMPSCPHQCALQHAHG